jgi:hypothetical protein
MIESEKNNATRRSRKASCVIMFACACLFAAMAIWPLSEARAADRLLRRSLEQPRGTATASNEMDRLSDLIANPHLHMAAGAQDKLLDQCLRLHEAILSAEQRADDSTFALGISATSGWRQASSADLVFAFALLLGSVQALVSLRKLKPSP